MFKINNEFAKKILSRKGNLFEKKFRLRATFKMIKIMLILSSLIIASSTIYLAYNSYKMNKELVVIGLEVENLTHSEIKNSLSQDQNEAFAINKLTMTILIILSVFVFTQGIIIYVLFIKKTNNIALPVYLMSKQMQSIIDGNMPETREIYVEGDFADLYDLFREMVEVLRLKEQKLEDQLEESLRKNL